MTPLPPFQGGYDGYAAGVNDRGQIVGRAENGVLETCNNQPPPVSQFLQFAGCDLWGPGLKEMTQLPPYPGDLDSAAATYVAVVAIGAIAGLLTPNSGLTKH
jgi:hypothetical protein